MTAIIFRVTGYCAALAKELERVLAMGAITNVLDF